ncbi:hypothetical protein [Pedobacter chinensis]|nr:hypothetical protein [Pedobacter chinensis]
MKDIKDIDLTDVPFTAFLKKFFESKTLEGHLQFVEEWLELAVTDKFLTERNSPADLLCFYEQLVELYQLSSDLNEDETTFERLKTDLSMRQVNPRFIPGKELLSEEEIMSPFLAIRSVFVKSDLAYYKSALHDWLENALHSCVSDSAGKCIFPLYSCTKKLLVAAWLIYEHLSRKISNEIKHHKISQFEDTCPLLLNDQHLKDPYLEIESFFSGCSLGEYQRDLKGWFKAALTEGFCFKKAGSLVYFHEQLIQLLQAGYLIVKNDLPYERNAPYCDHAATFGDWINSVRSKWAAEGDQAASDYDVRFLTRFEQEEPLLYLKKNLKLKKIKHIRYGLQEWLHCGLSKAGSISDLDNRYLYQLYEKLEKLLEAFFLLVAKEALLKTSILQEHEI